MDYLNKTKEELIEELTRLRSRLAELEKNASDIKRREEVLREYHERYKSVIDSIGIGVSFVSPDMEILSLNNKMREWFPRIDMTKKPICYKSFNTPPEEHVCSYCPTVKTLQDGQIHESVTETPTPEGIKNYRIVSAPIKNKEGKIVAAVEMVEDVTERKQAEEKFMHMYKTMYDILEKAPWGIYVANSAGNIEYVNPAMIDISGDTYEQFKSLNVFKLETYVKKGLTDQIKTALGGQPFFVGNFEYTSQYSRKTTIRNFIGIPLEEDGEKKVLVCVEDITERKNIENTLKQSEEKWRSLVENAPNIILIVDRDGTIQFINRTVPGLSMEETIGKKHYDYIEPQHHQVVKETIEKVFQTGGTGSYTIQGTGPDKTTSWYETQVGPIKHGDEVVAVTLITTDITERKKIEAELEKHREYLEDQVKERTAELQTANEQLSQEISERRKVQEALQASEIRFRTMFEQAPLSIIVFSPDGIPIKANKAHEELWGISADMLDGYNILEDDQLEVYGLLPYIKKAFEGEVSYIPEMKITSGKHLDQQCWIKGFVYPVKNLNGGVSEIILVHEDITDRKRAEEELSQSKEKYQRLVESTFDWVWSLDAEGKNTYSNEAVIKLLGYEVTEIREMHMLDLVHEDDKELVKETHAAALADKQGWKDVVVRMHHKNGSVCYFEISAQPVFEHSGNVVGFNGISHDITERRKAEEALRESEALYRSLVETSPDAIGLIDLDANILMVNQQTVEMFGFENTDEVIGKSAFDFIAQEDRERARKNMNSIVEAGSSRNKKYTLIRKDETLFVGELTSSVICNAKGDPIAFVSVIRDITERIQAEQALKDSEEKYKNLIETTNTGYLILNTEGEVIDANPEYVRLTGYKNLDQIRGRSVIEWTARHDAERNAQEVKKCMANGFVRNLEIDYVSPEGEIAPVEINATVIETSEGPRILSLCRDISARRKAEIALGYRVEFERFITLLSTHFITISSDDIEKGIHEALKAIGEFVDVDRSYLFLFSEDLTTMSNTYEWCAEGIQPLQEKYQDMPTDKFPVFTEKMRKFETIYVPRVDDLLAEAQSEKAELQRGDIKSMIAVPITYGGKLIGFLGFDSVREEKLWEQDIITLIKIVGEIFANAFERKWTEEALRESEAQYRTTLDSMGDAIHVVDRDLKVILFNERLKSWNSELGFATDLIGKGIFEIFPFLPRKIRDEYRQVFENGKTLITEETNRIGDQEFITETRKIPIFEGNQAIRVVTVIRNITARKQAEAKLKESENKYRTIFESANDIIVFIDNNGKVVDINEKIVELGGFAKKEIVGKNLSELKYLFTEKSLLIILKNFMKRMAGINIPHYEVDMLKKNKEIANVEINAVAMKRDDKIVGDIAILRDVTERKKSKEKMEELNKELLKTNKRLKQLALRDIHTGLYNYRYLQDVIEAEFYRSKRYSHSLSVIMLDIDYFKSINDVYGHPFGDLVLLQFSKQLKRMIRRYDVIIRYGGEEFLIVSPGTDRSTAFFLAQRILNALNLYNFGNRKHTVKLKISVSVASYPEDKALKGMDLIKLSDYILNKVKEDGGDKVYSSLEVKKGKPFVSKKVAETTDVKELKEKVEKLNRQTNQNLIEAIFAFAKTIEFKDHFTGEHVEKTVHYATEVARELKLPTDEVERIRQAAMLHDLGKIGISETILLKKGKLTKEEFEEIKKHPQIGVDIIRPIKLLHGLIPLMLHHHERWDGKGYPHGLKGDEIPLGARIISIADVYEALTSDRPYRKAFSKNEAIEIIKNDSGKKFEPRIVDVFLKIVEKE